MPTVRLVIEINHDHVEPLKTRGYNLCIARTGASGTDSHGTVIWKGDNNDFRLLNDYRVFGVLSDTTGAILRERVTTVPQKIEFGQTCNIDETGKMNPATGQPDQSGTFTVTNNWKDTIPVGVTYTLTGSKPLVDLPLYESPLAPQGTMHFTPTYRISVYFEADDQTIGGIPNPT
ncbi:hypothetical protein FRC17_005033, partial [Serendipita sp. 399]